jgi:ASC-1-like (ASCH) protein
MYEAIPFKDFDCEGWSMEEMVSGTYEFILQNKKESGVR